MVWFVFFPLKPNRAKPCPLLGGYPSRTMSPPQTPTPIRHLTQSLRQCFAKPFRLFAQCFLPFVDYYRLVPPSLSLTESFTLFYIFYIFYSFILLHLFFLLLFLSFFILSHGFLHCLQHLLLFQSYQNRASHLLCHRSSSFSFFSQEIRVSLPPDNASILAWKFNITTIGGVRERDRERNSYTYEWQRELVE